MAAVAASTPRIPMDRTRSTEGKKEPWEGDRIMIFDVALKVPMFRYLPYCIIPSTVACGKGKQFPLFSVRQLNHLMGPEPSPLACRTRTERIGRIAFARMGLLQAFPIPVKRLAVVGEAPRSDRESCGRSVHFSPILLPKTSSV